jgi:phospholipid-binding lipoprotein MlaA
LFCLLLGPSSSRDAVGTVVDWFIDPIYYIEDDETRLIMRATKVVDKRADLLTASNVVEKAAIDPYAFVRDAYLQRRQNQVFDGNPPE